MGDVAETSLRRPVRAPHGLNLVALEELRELVLVLRHHARERHGQVVPQREIRFAAGLVFAALQDLENELVALFTVLADQRFDVLERRRLERLEAVPLVDTADDPDDVFAPADVRRQEVARSARRLRRH
jgi:hypothetical protein